MQFKEIKELENYINSENVSTKYLLDNLTTMIIIENTYCHLKIFNGNKGWTIHWESNDKSKGTPNITDKIYDFDKVIIKAIKYLLENGFHKIQNQDRNILSDMITVKN